MSPDAINVKKRNGRGLEPLDIQKIHSMVKYACEGLAGVSESQVEMSSGLQFYDGMSTDDIQQILIKSASDLITLESPNYQYVAARLLFLDIDGVLNTIASLSSPTAIVTPGWPGPLSKPLLALRPALPTPQPSFSTK